jgi:hypothetical protein
MSYPVTAVGIGADVAPLGRDQTTKNVRTWKTITLGNYGTVIELRDALVHQNIWIGDIAGQMLRLPTFALTSGQADIALSIASVRQLGLQSGTSFTKIHASAMEHGLDLCPPEVGPQLRLQYLDQKVGEYLLIGMKPLPTADGSLACFVVGNGGAGLFIIGRSAGAESTVPSRARLVFVLRR